ncbi:zinc finger, CCHC-type containing LTR copia-type gag-polypeptide [Tanacetum coccineum]
MKQEGLKGQRRNSSNDDKISEDLLKEGNKNNIDDLLKRIKTTDPDKEPLDACKRKEAFSVRKWTRKLNLLEKDYIFIPVNYKEVAIYQESHELFLISLHDTNTTTPPAAFNAQHTINKSGHGRGQAFTSRGNTSRGRGRRTPHCQLCRTNGHCASSCPNLSTYATRAASTDESLAQAFHAKCHVTTNNPDWHVDSGATDHMTPNFESLHHSTPYQGNEKVP